MTATTAEAGRTDDGGALHAVRPGLTGAVAVCGAGRITSRVPGRFDPDAEGACPACASATST